MTAISDLVLDLQLMLPDTPDPVLERALLRAAQRFCTRSRVWRQDMAAVAPANNSYVIELAPVSGAVRVAPVVVRLNGAEVTLAGDEVTQVDRSGRRPGRVFYEAESLVFDGLLKGTDSVEGRFVMAPAEGATTLPDTLVFDWRDALVSGAAVQLFRNASGDTYNERLAMLHGDLFEAAIREARGRSRDGWSHAKRTVAYGGL